MGRYFGNNSFDKIFIESGNKIIEFSTAGINTHELIDLW